MHWFESFLFFRKSLFYFELLKVPSHDDLIQKSTLFKLKIYSVCFKTYLLLIKCVCGGSEPVSLEGLKYTLLTGNS